MICLTDQVGNELKLTHAAGRIVSVVPSQTELLHYFGLEKETIGITKFCIHPKKWFDTKTRVGGTKNLNLDKIRALKPDLIIANKEENTQEDIELLQKEFQVYISDINTIEDAYGMIKAVSLLVGKQQQGVDLIDQIQEDFEEIRSLKGSVVYFIWEDPYMVCGTNNFIHAILQKIGLNNCVLSERYREIDMEELLELKPDYVFLSSEPYPFKEEHKQEFEKIINSKVMLVDGEMFSWYGSRMLKMKDYFNSLV